MTGQLGRQVTTEECCFEDPEKEAADATEAGKKLPFLKYDAPSTYYI